MKQLKLPDKTPAKDPSKVNQGGVIGTDNERQVSLREQIADGADQFRVGDLTEVDELPPKVVAEEPEPVKEPEPAPEPQPEPAPEVRKLKIKVGGKELELT